MKRAWLSNAELQRGFERHTSAQAVTHRVQHFLARLLSLV